MARSRADIAIKIQETQIMRKAKAMFPAVSRRALPEGNRSESTLFTARWETKRRMLAMGSKMESAAANRVVSIQMRFFVV